METEYTYECGSCHRTATINESEAPPVCCGKPMQKPLREICLQPSHAEHARPMEHDDACDEGREGT
jgi:hypothetical protein